MVFSVSKAELAVICNHDDKELNRNKTNHHHSTEKKPAVAEMFFCENMAKLSSGDDRLLKFTEVNQQWLL